MPSTPLLRTRTRVLFVIFFCITFLGLASLWAVSQRATNRVKSNTTARAQAVDRWRMTRTYSMSNRIDPLCWLNTWLPAPQPELRA